MKEKLNVLVVLLMVIVLLGSTSVVFAEGEDLGSWETKASLYWGRNSLGVTEANGKIYAIGGYKGNEVNIVEEYDPATDTWTTKRSMPTARASLGVAEVNGKIYAIGGYNNKYLNTVEEYDPATDTWTTKASMRYTRKDLGVVEVNGKIYAIGGNRSTTGDGVNEVEEYDPGTNTWTTKSSMPTARHDFGIAEVSGKIYAIGGEHDGYKLNTVEEYDPVTDTWTTKANMPTNRYGLGAAEVNGRIYAIGGYKSSGVLKTVEEYDPVTDTWTTNADMPTARRNLGIAELDGKIYAIGGYPSDKVVEAFTPLSTQTQEPTLDIIPQKTEVKVGETFSVDAVLKNVTNICAEDVTITYDTDRFELVGTEDVEGFKIYHQQESPDGTLRFVVASLGKDHAITGEDTIIKLKLKAKAVGEGLVDATKGRIADNSTLEVDIAEENCLQATITVTGYADINKSGHFTLLDLGIDAWYFGDAAADTDTTNHNADIVENGTIDDDDLTEVVAQILANTEYEPNN